MATKQNQIETDLEQQDISTAFELGDAIAIGEDDSESPIQAGESSFDDEPSESRGEVDSENLEELLNQLLEEDADLATEPEESEESEGTRGASVSKTVVTMHKVVNHIRQKQGIPPLKLDTRLTAAAQSHSNDMARHKRLTHEGSDGSSASDRARRQGYPAGAGENVALGSTSVKDVMVRWMKSPLHRKNILGRKYKSFGAGYAKNGRLYWTQTFGLR